MNFHNAHKSIMKDTKQRGGFLQFLFLFLINLIFMVLSLKKKF